MFMHRLRGLQVPRLAEKWEASPDVQEWTVCLRQGVPCHFGDGECTARDVVPSRALMSGLALWAGLGWGDGQRPLLRAAGQPTR